MTTQVITIDTITIKQDAAGRYCLNDFHKAAGGVLHHQPAKFLANQGTSELVDELRKSPNSESFDPVATVKGRTGGTFVVKELVYAYAMWISPSFHLKVIRAYDRLATQGTNRPWISGSNHLSPI